MSVLHFTGRLQHTASLMRRRMSMYISLFTVARPVNYTKEFQKNFEATSCYILFPWHKS